MKRYEDPYLSQAEFYAMRAIKRVHAVVAWAVAAAVVAGVVCLALSVWALFNP